MNMLVSAAHHSQTGLRPINEDGVGMLTTPQSAQSNRDMIFVVADGVSGNAGGEQASKATVQGLLSGYAAAPKSESVPLLMQQVIHAVHRRILQQASAQAQYAGMASTLTCLVLRDPTYYFSHVGDSRLYLLRAGNLQCLTTDHVNSAPDLRQMLTRAIGHASPLVIDQASGELQVGDIFLLATDGVWSALPEHELSWHLATLQEPPHRAELAAKLLVDAALAAGSQDNASALVLRINQIRQSSDQITRRHRLNTWKILGGVALLLNLILLLMLIVG